ncbi:MAG: TetR/AcrR family transcriptional regulator [Acidimicrobiales bacterium]
MGKPRLSREARRQQILDAAAQVFGRLGFEATRMDDVAKAASVSKGLLYKHFPSKDDLFRALVERQGASFAAELRTALAGSDVTAKPEEALRSGLSFWLAKMGDPTAAFNLTDPGTHNAYDSLRNSLREVIAEAIRAAAPGTLEPYPRLLAALIQGAAENLGLVWRDDRGRVSQAEALTLLTAFCWGGINSLVTSDA